MERLKSEDLYIPLEANEVLTTFIVNNWPDETLFNDVIFKLLKRVKGKGRNVRVIGEMVALLW